MKFGSFKLDEAKGGILAHSLSLPNGKRLRKGVLIDEAIINQIKKAGINTITVAMPDEEDVLENVAATLIAQQFSNPHFNIEEASTGRVNIFATCSGLFEVNSEAINKFNTIDPSITIATLPAMTSVNEGRLVATIKIIPYAVHSKNLEAVLALNLSQAMILHPFKSKRVGLISTQLPSLKSSVIDKTYNTLEQRLNFSGSLIAEEMRVDHDAASIAQAISKLSLKCDVLIIFGASAISDIADCIPEGVTRAGGEVLRFGMPVDPGNLLLLAKAGDIPVIGAPGCARSIAENGFDWVLNRLLADVKITADDIANMGVGGLLMETGSRPHPREASSQSSPVIAGVILAAGQSRRMGDLNKMTVEINGKPMVRHVAEAAVNSRLSSLYVVTGHEASSVVEALDGIEFKQLCNSNYRDGLSTSLVEAITGIDSQSSHALILLGDMPFITSQMLDDLISVCSKNPEHIIVATHDGKRGNPVLWPCRFFEELKTIQGDVGARHIMAANQDRVIEVELGEAASLDLDTPEAIKMITSP